MARKTSNSRKAAIAAGKILQKNKKAVLLDICVDLSEAAKGNNNRIPYGYVCDTIKKLKPSYKWFVCDIVDKKKPFRKYQQHAKENNNNQYLDSGLVSETTVETFPLCESIFADITNDSEFQVFRLMVCFHRRNLRVADRWDPHCLQKEKR